MKKLKVWQLLLGLLFVVGGATLFVLAVSGVFGGAKVKLSSEYICGESCDGEYIELSADDYEKLIADKKSFVIFVDQGGCTTADRLEGFVKDWSINNGIKVYKIMFEDMKKTSLYNSVKYYPSVAVVSSGKVVNFLRADSDEDADAYNKYDAFLNWMRFVEK
ncbi:hypothetical protein IKG24_00025 [Candidatus Saccharibacteria bacterium]|nr:hypothetical protein [Candidatus Saccharibacteria bacterium]